MLFLYVVFIIYKLLFKRQVYKPALVVSGLFACHFINYTIHFLLSLLYINYVYFSSWQPCDDIIALRHAPDYSCSPSLNSNISPG